MNDNSTTPKPIGWVGTAIGDQLSDPSAWKCDACSVSNKADSKQCACCEVARPGSESNSNDDASNDDANNAAVPDQLERARAFFNKVCSEVKKDPATNLSGHCSRYLSEQKNIQEEKQQPMTASTSKPSTKDAFRLMEKESGNAGKFAAALGAVADAIQTFGDTAAARQQCSERMLGSGGSSQVGERRRASARDVVQLMQQESENAGALAHAAAARQQCLGRMLDSGGFSQVSASNVMQLMQQESENAGALAHAAAARQQCLGRMLGSGGFFQVEEQELVKAPDAEDKSEKTIRKELGQWSPPKRKDTLLMAAMHFMQKEEENATARQQCLGRMLGSGAFSQVGAEDESDDTGME